MTLTATPSENFVANSEDKAKKEKPRFVVKTWHALVVGIVLGCAYNFVAA